MKKLLGIVVLGLLMGCATTDSIVSSKKLEVDMSKSDFQNVFFTSYASDDPTIPGGGSEFYASSGKEIIWGSGKKMFYVFKNVSRPISCGFFLCKLGNGTLERWYYDLGNARASISGNTSTTTSSTKKVATGGREKMLEEIKGVPGVADAGWPQKESLWIFMSNPTGGHDFDRLGYTICNGAVTNFGVQKGYSITFWNPYNKKEIGKFRCY